MGAAATRRLDESRGRTVAVVGAGWAGLAAAVEATRLGHAVTVFEMARQPGGRARSVDVSGQRLDNGQHICIGAYRETLRLMSDLGIAEAEAFLRMPLCIVDPQGAGLRLRPGAPLAAFTLAVLRHGGWRWRDRIAFLRMAASWALAGFRCEPAQTVAALTARMPAAVRADLIDPLCVAALNTPAAEASAQVFLRILQDALFSGAGSADLLLPRVSLADALPAPAMRWLENHGAAIRLSQRVDALCAWPAGWSVDGAPFDRVILATSALEAARLTRDIAPGWAHSAAALRYEPIVTLYLGSAGTALPEAMLTLHADDSQPAQFVFDRGRLGGPPGELAFVVSGAQAWVDRGRPAILDATIRQAEAALGRHLRGPLREIAVLTEKRATFRCTPGLRRPPPRIAAGLYGAGDYIDGPYPATLEGAVRSGLAAARADDPAS